MSLSGLKKIFLSANFLILIGLLAFICVPATWPVRLPVQFWIKQGTNYLLWVGIFYLNLLIIIPRLLYKSKIGLFLLLILGFLIAIVLVDHQIDTFLNIPVLMEKVFRSRNSPVSYKNSPIPDMSAIVFTLLVISASIIVAVGRKVQEDKLREQNLEKEKISSELSFLKAQINPHFFFNILHTIYALTDTNKQKAKDSIYTLSHMMRYVLYETKNDLTTLEKEIAFVEDYISLMQLRLSNEVQVIFDKQENLKNVEVAPMLFLPFIENAFKHGISSVHPSYVYIGIHQITNTLQIEVRNSVFAEKMENLEESNGIGLVNTERRLSLIYPGKHQLKVDNNKADNEFTVILKLNLQ
ncbi:MAG TPA: histidine kinase [Mucilaginibacter sp.]|jgi:sensor histidine kinase YesM